MSRAAWAVAAPHRDTAAHPIYSHKAQSVRLSVVSKYGQIYLTSESFKYKKYLIKWNKIKPKRVRVFVIEWAGENFNQSEDPLAAGVCAVSI